MMYIPPKTEKVYTIGNDGYLNVRDLSNDGKILLSIRISEDIPLTSMVFLENTGYNEMLIASKNGKILHVNLRMKSVVHTVNLFGAAPLRYCETNQ